MKREHWLLIILPLIFFGLGLSFRVEWVTDLFQPPKPVLEISPRMITPPAWKCNESRLGWHLAGDPKRLDTYCRKDLDGVYSWVEPKDDNLGSTKLKWQPVNQNPNIELWHGKGEVLGKPHCRWTTYERPSWNGMNMQNSPVLTYDCGVK
jgi:hypothetical protein